MSRFGFGFLFLSIVIGNSLEAQENTRNGALLGGAAGAVIGGIVGNNKNDQTAEGALIGGAVGAVTGGLIGHHRDTVIADQQRYVQPHRPYPTRSYGSHRAPYSTRHYHYNGYPTYVAPGQPTVVYSAPVVTRHGVYRTPSRLPASSRRPVGMNDVVHMTRNGVSDAVIVSHIQANGVAAIPSVDDVIVLSKEGVSDIVITAMQTGGSVEVATESNTGTVELMPAPPLPSPRRGF